VADFLSEEWFEALNESLRAAGAAPLEPDAAPIRVVLEITGGPVALPHALTLTAGAGGASAAPGDHLAADALLRLSFEDAAALTSGRLDSANALREGRIKVRGDVAAIVPLLEWLQRAHPRTGA
jgi:SCP-2 sterol transfer family